MMAALEVGRLMILAGSVNMIPESRRKCAQ